MFVDGEVSHPWTWVGIAGLLLSGRPHNWALELGLHLSPFSKTHRHVPGDTGDQCSHDEQGYVSALQLGAEGLGIPRAHRTLEVLFLTVAMSATPQFLGSLPPLSPPPSVAPWVCLALLAVISLFTFPQIPIFNLNFAPESC